MIKITKQDLANLHSFAVKNCVDLPRESEYHKDSHKLQAYTYLIAAISLLNSKNNILLEVEVDNGVEK